MAPSSLAQPISGAKQSKAPEIKMTVPLRPLKFIMSSLKLRSVLEAHPFRALSVGGRAKSGNLFFNL